MFADVDWSVTPRPIYHHDGRKGADVYAEKVVHHLRGLGEYLITVDDIQTYLQGLGLPPEMGVKHLELEGANFDVKTRATDLKDDPFYGPHTQAILKELS